MHPRIEEVEEEETTADLPSAAPEHIPPAWLVTDSQELQGNDDDVPLTQLDMDNHSGTDGASANAENHHAGSASDQPDQPTAGEHPPNSDGVAHVPNFEPHVNSEGHRKICKVLLPQLLVVLREREYSLASPREQVREACRRIFACYELYYFCSS